MEQLEFSIFFEMTEYDKRKLKRVVLDSFLFVKKNNPHPIAGETMEDYHLFIRDETLLEIAHRLTNLATKRDKARIKYLYGSRNNENQIS